MNSTVRRSHRRVAAIIWLFAIMAAPLSLSAGRDNRLVVGLTNRFLLAPAFNYIYGTAANQIEVREFATGAELRKAFAAGEIDMIIDSQQGLALLPPEILNKTAIVWDVASSYGSIAIVSQVESGGPESASKLDQVSITLESGTPPHYFSIWIADVMSFYHGGPALSFRREPYITKAIGDKLVIAAALEEPAVSAILKRNPDATVISSTSSYQPIIHYVAAVRDSSISSSKASVASLMEAFYTGEELASSWENLMLETGVSCGMTASDVMVHIKYVFFDRAYNTESFFGLGLGRRIIEAATSTWQQAGLIHTPSAKAKAQESAIQLSDSLVASVQSQGKVLRPIRPPWSDREIEILVEQTEIGFALNSAVIPEVGRNTLTSVVHKINKVCGEGYRIKVEGYADSLGTPEHNLKLSRERAEAVAGFLGASLGLPTEDIEWVGHGVGGDDPSYRKTVITVLQKVVSTQ